MNTQNRTQARNKAPVSNHPLFPAIVALWFGALFGLGSLAVRPSLIESFVINSHLDVLLPMAAPPLGITSRILLALTMAAIGIAAGTLLARRIARPKPVERQRKRQATNVVLEPKARRYNAPDQDPYGLNEAKAEAVEPPPSSRRRSLATQPEVRDPYHHDEAPLPGGSPAIFDITQYDLDTPDHAEPAPMAADEASQPLELDSYAQPEQVLNVEPPVEAALPGNQEDCLMLDAQSEVPAMPAQEFSAPQVFAAPQQTFDPAPPQARPFDAAPPPYAAPASFAPPTAVEESAPAPFAADLPYEAPQPELRRFAGPDADEAISLPVAETAHEMAFVPSAASEPAPQDSGSERIASANLAEMSPVELIERFARALKAKRHSGAIPDALLASAAAFTAPDAPAEFSPPAPEPAPVPAAAPIPVGFGESSDAPAVQPLALPTAMRPLDFSDYEEQDDQPSYVPARSINMPAVEQPPADTPATEPQFADPVAATANEVVEDEGDALEEGYSSLLDLSRPAPLRQTFVRIDEPVGDYQSVEPVVIFPGQDAPLGTRFGKPAEVAGPAVEEEVPEPEDYAPTDGSVAPLRRFDAPTPAAAPSAFNPAVTQDPAEAERALRSALANLQRMSGAA